jgi:hypothetical protein
MTSRRHVVTPVHVWEEIVAELAVPKKFFLDIVPHKLLA